MQRRSLCAGILGGAVLPHSLTVSAMPSKPVNATGHAYAQACLIESPARLLFVSGQVPADENQQVPKTFEQQCRLAWRNVEMQLKAAEMALTDLVKVTIFLCDRRYRAANAAVRKELLGAHSPALTIIITGIYDEAWAAGDRSGRGRLTIFIAFEDQRGDDIDHIGKRRNPVPGGVQFGRAARFDLHGQIDVAAQ